MQLERRIVISRHKWLRVKINYFCKGKICAMMINNDEDNDNVAVVVFVCNNNDDNSVVTLE